MGERSLNPLQSVLTTTQYAFNGRFRMPKSRVGDIVTTDADQAFTIYCETTVESHDDPSKSEAVLVFQFHLWFMPAPIVPYVVRIFEPLSILTTPFFTGLPGFQTELWLFDHDIGDYLGIYQWETADDAKQYARALHKLMTLLSMPGSVSYEIADDTSLDDYLTAHSLTRRGETVQTLRSVTRLTGKSAVIAGLLGAVFWVIGRPKTLQWGATNEEVNRQLPGDELVSERCDETTRAITIETSADDVWPWIVQLGQGRGGFYSYTWLENVVGADIHNADRIVPELQELEEGDSIRMVREDYWLQSPITSMTVERIEPGRTLVLQGHDGGTWTFHLDPIDGETTRLIVRGRKLKTETAVGSVVRYLTYELPHFVMERGMLRGIKARAERYGKDGSSPMEQPV